MVHATLSASQPPLAEVQSEDCPLKTQLPYVFLKSTPPICESCLSKIMKLVPFALTTKIHNIISALSVINSTVICIV